MLKMVDGTGIIGVDMICPLGVSTPQPPNYDRVELEGTGMLVLPNSLDAPLERLELGGKTEQVQTTGAQLLPFPYVTGDMTKNGVTFAVQEDGGIKVTGTATEYVIFNIAKIDFGAESIFNNSTGNGKVLSGGKDNVKIEYHGLNKNTYLSVEKGLTVNTVIYPQLQNGNSATPYEPYTGGKPSPSPEYPQEIKNSGKWNEETRKYEVDVKVTGKNRFDREKAKDVSNWISIEGDGYLKFPIRAKKGSMITFSYTEKLTKGKKFYLGIAKKETGSVIAWLYHDTNLSVSNSKYTIAAEEDYVYLMCTRSSIRSFLDTIQTLQVEISPAQTDYQPYAEQTLTLTSDRPLTKWDKLVEQDGQIGWLYQSSKMILDGTKIKWLHSNKPENSYFATTIIDAYGGKGASFCKTYRNIQDPAYDIKYANERCIYSDHPTYTSGDKFFRAPNENVTTLEQWKEFIDENPIEMLYHTKNSEFVPLPQSEQNAIRALKTYYPTTVITADGGELDPDIKVTYRKEI